MKPDVFEITHLIGFHEKETYFRIRAKAEPHDEHILAAPKHHLPDDMKPGWVGTISFRVRPHGNGFVSHGHLVLEKASTQTWADFPFYEGPDIAAGTPYPIYSSGETLLMIAVFKEDVSAMRLNEIAASLPKEDYDGEAAPTTSDGRFVFLELAKLGLVDVWHAPGYETPTSWDMPAPRLSVKTPPALCAPVQAA